MIDGHSILNRAYYGLPEMTNSKGIHTNAILGFLNIMFKLLEEENPTHLCVAFDVRQPTFRHIKYPKYKGTRKPMPEELREQVPKMKEVLRAMNIPIIEKGGYEADDILGTLSRTASRQGYQVCIISGDRDLLQLATENIMVRIPKTKMSGTIVENYNLQDVIEKYQVTPTEFIDLKGLMGDSSDNIPGVPGIGEKSATKIIKEYHSIENAYAHIEELMPKKAQNSLRENYEQAVLSKMLATIKLDCELEFEIDDAVIVNMFNTESYELFKTLELKSILKRFNAQEMIAETNKTCNMQIQMVEELVEAEEIFEKIKKNHICGVELVASCGRVFGIMLCYLPEIVHFVPVGGFISESYIIDKLSMLMTQNVTVSFIRVKPALSYVSVSIDEISEEVFDISVAAYLLNPMKDTYGYDDIARDYLGETLPSKQELMKKDTVNEITILEDSTQRCMAYGAYVAYHAYKVLEDKLVETKMHELFHSIEMPTVFVLYGMEQAGIRVDKQALLKYGEQLAIRIDEIEEQIYQLAGKRDFNLNSPKQLGVILFETMQLPGGKKTKTGYSTSVEVLDKIANEHPIIPLILEYRQLTKLKSTYADGLKHFIQKDNRIHSTFNQTITATGRISSTDPNLQNIPMRLPLGREIRKVFIPEEGYVFVDADYSQIELRVLAHLSQDKNLIQAFQNHMDIHATTASEVFDVPIDQVTSLQRRNAKAVNFGIVYGISAFGLSRDLSITRKEAADYIDKYYKTYPQIKHFLNRTVEEAKESGYVSTMFKRIRPIPELKSSNGMTRSFGERIAMNSPIQGTAADIIKIAMVKVSYELKKRKLKSRLILQIHDELLVEALKSEVELVKEIITNEMMQAAKLLVPLEIDIHSGMNWYDAK